MRILQIRFKNLNSLTGEWSVDFTHPEYTADGIFAITGPTGAGKTTLLDAICLALYGRTPRLNRVTKRSNEIMSRQTGECFAEVVFETQAGQFRCHWSHHRARKRPVGELQPPRHEVADAYSGKVLQSRLRDTGACIEALTGMDFERFTRSMLLAQGGFAAFLQAQPDERAPILEQITGTEIYSRISIKVHELRSEERKKRDNLEAELDGLQLLTEDQQSELELSLKAGNAAEKNLALLVDRLKKAVSWRESLSRLENELTALEKQQQDLEQRQAAFDPRRIQLARAHKALALEGEAARTVALRTEQEKEKADLSAARRDLPRLEAALSRAMAQKEMAAQKLLEKRTHQEGQAAVIRKVREIDVRIENQRFQVQIGEDAIRDTEKQSAAYRIRLGQLETSLKTEQTALDEIDHYLQRHAADSSLVENMTAIGRLFDTLQKSNAALNDARKALEKAVAKTQATGTTVETRETAHRQCRNHQRRARSAHEQSVLAVAKLLDGRELSDWRNELEALRERTALLEKLKETFQRRDDTDRAAAAAETRRRHLKRDMTALSVDISRQTGEKALQEEKVRRLGTQAALLARIRDLEVERRHLEDGRPCPLCGATEHPFATGNIPVVDDAEVALERSREALQRASDRLSELQVKLAETRKDIQQTEEQQKELRASLVADAKQCDKIFLQLALAADTPDPTDTVDRELINAQTEIAAISGTLQKGEKETEKSEAARKILDAARAALVDSEKALQEARHRQDTASREQQRLECECMTRELQVESLRREAAETVQAYDVGHVSVSGLDSLLEALNGRRDSWRKRQQDRREHEKRYTELERQAEKQRVLQGRLENELRSRRREREQLQRQLEEFQGSRSKLYGNKHPDHEEKRLAEGIQTAEKVLEHCRLESARMEQEVGRLREKAKLLKDSTRKRAGLLSEAEHSLTKRLKQEGFEDEQDFREASLPPKKREELLAQEESLRRQEAELRSLLQEKSAALEAERARKITEESIGNLSHKLREVEMARQEAQQEIGALKERLAANRQQQTRRQERLKLLDIQQKEYERWNVLHSLIGSADGKKYRNFAQGLTFEIMTAHANRQLTGMTDRYLLIRDEDQPLELNVIDNYQAGEIRSTKNLSGGESFIVSLALALGLSQMASRNVRVDSLFLDEGFGTLDEDALETALNALAGLQQEGKLIGVISHVPALKERIATRIQVIREAGGRSRVVGPGCRRVVTQ